MENLKLIKIMLVEDDPGDQKLIQKSLANQRIANEIIVVESGEEAFDYLSCDSDEYPAPELILLDLNMPGMGGMEFLRRIKANNKLDTIPVIILTTSDSDQDVLDSYKLHASGYIKKPVALQEFHEVMRTLEDYWFAICKRVSQAQLQCSEQS